MKHIKKWKSINESGYLDEFYEEIGQDEYFLTTVDRIKFDNKLYNQILSLFYKDLMDWSPKVNNNGIYMRPIILQKDVSLSVNKYCISIKNIYIKMDIFISDDEWFYVKLSSVGIIQYYKCDQYEGLVKLLKDFKFI